MRIKVQVHGHIASMEAFKDLEEAFGNLFAHKGEYRGHVPRATLVRQGRTLARNEFLRANANDEGLEFVTEYEPEGSISAILDCGTRHAIDITVRRDWVSNQADGAVSFVRNGGEPLHLPIAGGKVAVTEDTLAILRRSGADDMETITRLFGVLRDAENLPRFTLSDEVVEAAAPARRKSM